MYSIHYLIGLRYSYKTMLESEITIICSHYEMAVAKQLAFSLGKKIYPIFVFFNVIYKLLRVKNHGAGLFRICKILCRLISLPLKKVDVYKLNY